MSSRSLRSEARMRSRSDCAISTRSLRADTCFCSTSASSCADLTVSRTAAAYTESSNLRFVRTRDDARARRSKRDARSRETTPFTHVCSLSLSQAPNTRRARVHVRHLRFAAHRRDHYAERVVIRHQVALNDGLHVAQAPAISHLPSEPRNFGVYSVESVLWCDRRVYDIARPCAPHPRPRCLQTCAPPNRRISSGGYISAPRHCPREPHCAPSWEHDSVEHTTPSRSFAATASASLQILSQVLLLSLKHMIFRPLKESNGPRTTRRCRRKNSYTMTLS